MSSIKVVPPESLPPCSEWKCIGCGQFGDVFKVKHKEYKIDVAVKKLKENVSFLHKELLAEAEKIKHASENHFVVRLIGIVKAPPCIVMELTENGCLGKLMERVREIPWPLKYRFLYEVALGMNWLHSLSPPLLHLDLKPRNVLLNDALHIRITDFGLSKYISSSTANGDIEEVGGTLAYMPPEAFQEGYSPSKSTDIYSFAILSAVVLRGADPYPVVFTALISLNIPHGQRPSFDSLKNISSVKNLDKAIEFTKRCWHNDKQQRPSFDVCINQWETILSAYQDKEIKDSVTAVQMMLNDSTDSSGSSTDVQQSASTPNSTDMSDAIRQMKNIHFAEQPSAKLEAIPPAERSYPRGSVQRLPPTNQPRPNAINHAPSTPNPRTGMQPVGNSQHMQVQHSRQLPGQIHQPRQMGFNHRGNSAVYRTGTPTVRNSQIISNHSGPLLGHGQQPGQMRFNHGTNSYITGSHQGVPHWANSSQVHQSTFPSHNFQTQFGQPAFPSFPFPNISLPPPTVYSNISLNNNMGPCQIGDNNNMSYGVTRNHQNTFNNPMTRHPRTRPTSYPPQIQTTNITVSDSTGPLQIGDNNTMVVGRSGQYQGVNSIPITPQPGQPTFTSSRVSAKSVQSPQQAYTSQVSFPTKAAEDFSDVTQPTQDTEKQTDQPQERLTMPGTTVNDSLQGKGNVD